MRISKQKIKLFLLLAFLLWGGLFLLDWGFRFVWYGWHRTLLLQPSFDPLIQKPQAPRQQRTESLWGGNLSHLIGIRSVARRFEEQRPTHEATIDEYGFYNEPPTTQRWYDIVVTGDSFMTTPDWIEDTFPSQLAKISGHSVYNFARKGVGPFIGALSFFQDERFRSRPPKVLVFGAVEADISGPLYVGLIYQLQHPSSSATNPTIDRTRVHWAALTAARLKTSLPNTSVLAQAARKIWTGLRYYLFSDLSADVVVAEQKEGEAPLLFYRYNLQSMQWTLAKRDLPRVRMTFQFLDQYCRERGIRLVVVLIPDKEEVYRERIPDAWKGLNHVPASSFLPVLEAELQSEGIMTISVLDEFRQQAPQETLLYWQDDTHWNAEGIRIAAEKTWAAIQPIFITNQPGRMGAGMSIPSLDDRRTP